MKIIPSRLFTWRQTLIYAAAFVGVFVATQRMLRYVCENWVTFDCPYYWPVSVFNVRFPSIRDLAVAAAVVVVFFLLIRLLEGKRFSIWLVSLTGVVLIAGLTFIHGIDVGYYAPIAGDAQSGILIPYSLDGQEYYHDALKVADPVDFFGRYNEIQPTLNRHSHTHPPGAVLTFYFLEKLFRDPALIALFIMFSAVIATVFFFYRLVRTEMSEETSRYMALLILLLPAVQIYYLASLDAFITAFLTGTLYLFCFGAGRRAVLGATAMLSAAFLLTFVSLFILPVLIGFDLIVRRSLRRSFLTIGGLAAIHILLYLFTGYNALQSFHTASVFENPNGFMLFVNPANYLFTRLEDVAEILFFFGPFLSILFIRGLKTNFGIWPVANLRLRPLSVLTVLGCGTLLGMYIAGAWRTGETARACAYIYPYLLFPVAKYLEESGMEADGRLQLASLIFAQSLGMQIFGNYFW